MIGKIISHYKILEELGAGGMGVVYKAEDTKLKRTVALKFLPPELTRDPKAKERFIKEAQAASALDHSNICTIHEIDETGDGRMFICMAHYAGETVKEKIERGPLGLEETVDIASQIATGLAKAHEKGIVHRDIKPANIMVTEDGQVKIADFGVAKLAGRMKMTKTGITVGTVAYMSPEQTRGEDVDARTDIWSLGVVLYEMLAGQPPFKGDYEQAVAYAVLNEEPPSITSLRPDVPPELVQITRKALAKEPDDRYSGANDLLADLKTLEKKIESKSLKEHAADTESTPSVAVLPFVNISPDPENEYFGDGLAEELINALTRLEGVKVAARTSAFRFRDRDVDIREIGAQLNVNTILEGSVRKAGNKLRITAQLIDIADGYHLWSERYDREMDDIFTVQDEITLAIVEQFKIKLSPQKKKAPLVKRYTENLEAYSLLLRGRYYWNSLTPEGWGKSLECFQKALEHDPDYALAHAWSAIWYQSQAFWGDVPPKESYRESVSAAKRALELDETIADTHNFLAVLYFTHDWNPKDAEREFKRSIELDPTSALIHANYAIILAMQRRFEEAIAEARLARRLDPLSSIISTWAALIPCYVGRYQEAIGQLQKVIAMDPDYWQAHYHLGVAYVYDSKPDKAIPEIEKALELSGGASITRAMLTCACYLTGRTDVADEHFESLKDRSRRSYVAPTFFAWIHIVRADADEGYRWMQRAVAEHDPWLCWYNIGPSTLRAADPRFDALLDDIGLP